MHAAAAAAATAAVMFDFAHARRSFPDKVLSTLYRLLTMQAVGCIIGVQWRLLKLSKFLGLC